METNTARDTGIRRTGLTWREVAEALWGVLDNIDTASDMFKENYEGFAKNTYRRVRLRFEYLDSDGYVLVPCDPELRNKKDREEYERITQERAQSTPPLRLIGELPSA